LSANTCIAAEERTLDEIEYVSAVFPKFRDEINAAEFDDSLPLLGKLVEMGVTIFQVTASNFVQSIDDLPAFCETLRRRFDDLA